MYGAHSWLSEYAMKPSCDDGHVALRRLKCQRCTAPYPTMIGTAQGAKMITPPAMIGAMINHITTVTNASVLISPAPNDLVERPGTAAVPAKGAHHTPGAAFAGHVETRTARTRCQVPARLGS